MFYAAPIENWIVFLNYSFMTYFMMRSLKIAAPAEGIDVENKY